MVFRKKFDLPEAPSDAQAVLLATQGASVMINGNRPKTTVADNSRSNRVSLMDITKLLKVGENTIAIDVQSHTDKGSLNEEESRQYPNSRNHLNRVPGLAFYARILACCEPIEIVTDGTWRVRRAPVGTWEAKDYDDWDWYPAAQLPEAVNPVDEGPALPPVRRKDYANEELELGSRLRSAVSTACFPGRARSSLRPADPLMVALDRPNREQVATSRLTAATTLQALELTNGDTLDSKLKATARRMAPDAAQDPASWLNRTYKQLLSRPPSDAERDAALEYLGEKPAPDRLADVLWSLMMLPEFQLIN